jgi:hypothetical protein
MNVPVASTDHRGPISACSSATVQQALIGVSLVRIAAARAAISGSARA